MILRSTVSAEASDYISGRLAALAHDTRVRILFAIESGSRAWGFPSADSDYDVRFVYTHAQDRYLSVADLRDVIETPTLDDEMLGVPLDLNGWDIRKSLQLALRSNPILREWLVSPIRYGQAIPHAVALLRFVDACADPAAYAYHYDRLARGAWEQIAAEAEAVKVKRYCYALRPVLMRLWLQTRDHLPPMDAASLTGGLDLGERVLAAMADLFARKRTAGEHDLLSRQAVLDDLIAGVLAQKPERPPMRDVYTPDLLVQADALFRAVIAGD